MPYLGTKPLDSVTVKDIDGQRFILDADADTSFHADTDDQIDIEIAGADDFQFTANTFTALSGSTIAAQALTATTGTFTSTVSSNGFNPDAADGAALGSASLEFSDLYLADSSVIYFGNDQDVRLIHNADAGLKLKMTNTSGNSGIGAQLILQTGDTDMAAGNSHGQILFQAPDEGTGTDAILAAAKISADAEGDFSSSSNATSLKFFTASSEDVGGTSAKMSLNSGGDLNVLTDGASIFFGASSEIELRHVADDGLILKHVGTGDGKEPSLTFQAGDNDIAANDVLGSIFFQAPDEGAGTDAVLVAAGIEAVSEGNFSSSNNATKLSFKTAASEAATEKMSLSSAGVLNLLDNTLQRANLKDYGEITSALGSAGGSRTVDLEDGNSFSATVTTSTVTWTFSNPTASDELCGFTLTLVNGGSQTVNWPGAVDWAGGSAPSLTSSGTDILVFFTIDGGTIWHGMIASTDSK